MLLRPIVSILLLVRRASVVFNLFSCDQFYFIHHRIELLRTILDLSSSQHLIVFDSFDSPNDLFNRSIKEMVAYASVIVTD